MRTSIKYLKPLLLLWVVTVMLAGCTYPDMGYTDPDQGRYEAGPPDDEFGDLWYWGDWLAVEPYGWVWQPHVVSSWSPFYHGHWMMTEWGWTWVSYEPFGWAVYHYGFWYYDAVWGWLWIPGYEWSPANVQWIVWGNYVAWAPLPPPGYELRDPWVIHSPEFWTVVDGENFTHSDVGRFRRRDSVIDNAARDAANVRRSAPEPGLIERLTRRSVEQITVDMTKVKRGGHEYQRMKLPPEQQRTVKQYEPRITKQILKPMEDRKPPPSGDKEDTGKETKTKTKAKDGKEKSTEKTKKKDGKEESTEKRKTKGKR